MTDLMLIWYVTGGLTGLIFSVAGYWMKKNPPTKINPIYGYRSKQSMENAKKWDAAQQFSAKKMIVSGILIMILSLARPFIPFIPEFPELGEVFLACSLSIIASLFVFISTELHLKKLVI